MESPAPCGGVYTSARGHLSFTPHVFTPGPAPLPRRTAPHARSCSTPPPQQPAKSTPPGQTAQGCIYICHLSLTAADPPPSLPPLILPAVIVAAFSVNYTNPHDKGKCVCLCVFWSFMYVFFFMIYSLRVLVLCLVCAGDSRRKFHQMFRPGFGAVLVSRTSFTTSAQSYALWRGARTKQSRPLHVAARGATRVWIIICVLAGRRHRLLAASLAELSHQNLQHVKWDWNSLSYMAHGRFKSTPEFVVYHGKEMTKEHDERAVYK